MIRAKLQQALPILVYLANSKGTQAGRPGVMVCTYPGVEVLMGILNITRLR